MNIDPKRGTMLWDLLVDFNRELLIYGEIRPDQLHDFGKRYNKVFWKEIAPKMAEHIRIKKHVFGGRAPKRDQ